MEKRDNANHTLDEYKLLPTRRVAILFTIAIILIILLEYCQRMI